MFAGLALVRRNFERSRRLSPEAKARCLGLMRGTLDYGDLSQVDLVIEAVRLRPTLNHAPAGARGYVCALLEAKWRPR